MKSWRNPFKPSSIQGGGFLFLHLLLLYPVILLSVKYTGSLWASSMQIIEWISGNKDFWVSCSRVGIFRIYTMIPLLYLGTWVIYGRGVNFLIYFSRNLVLLLSCAALRVLQVGITDIFSPSFGNSYGYFGFREYGIYFIVTILAFNLWEKRRG